MGVASCVLRCAVCCVCPPNQAGTLQELQKRFEQQEHQLVAATASASASNGSEGVQVEPYFPEDKVQQELSMLHKVRWVVGGADGLGRQLVIYACAEQAGS